MKTRSTYDPETQPDPATWLGMDEQQRMLLVERFHRRARIDLPNAKVHAAFHAMVENQIAEGVESVVRAVLRLTKQGLSRHDAVHAVSSVMADLIFEQSRATTKDTPEVTQARYEAGVQRLSASEWLSKYDPD